MTKMQDITCQLFEYVCAGCGEHYKAPVLYGGYGVFLLRNYADFSYRYLNVLEDSIFSEVESIIERSEKVSSLSKYERVDLFQKIVGVAYDENECGNSYGIDAEPECPFCKKHAVRKSIATNPPEYVEMQVPMATHHKWDNLSQVDRERLVGEKLRRLLD